MNIIRDEQRDVFPESAASIDIVLLRKPRGALVLEEKFYTHLYLFEGFLYRAPPPPA